MSSRSSTTDKTARAGAARTPRRPAPPRQEFPAPPPLVPEVAALPDTVEVGRVIKPHGIAGEMLIAVSSDVRGRFRPGRELLLVRDDAPVGTARIEKFRAAVAGGLLRLEGVTDRDGAEALRGVRLEVRREESPPSKGGSYYWFELVGCRCTDPREGELGVIDEVVEDGGGLMLRVVGKAADGRARELPVPWVESFVRRVDVGARTIEIELPEGYVEACASPS